LITKNYLLVIYKRNKNKGYYHNNNQFKNKMITTYLMKLLYRINQQKKPNKLVKKIILKI